MATEVRGRKNDLQRSVQKQAIRLGREQTPELSGDGERVLVRW